MKHDLFNWREVKADEKVQVKRGRVRVRCSREAALFAESEGVESLVGVGTAFDVTLGEAAALTLDGPADVRWFVGDDGGTSVPSEGEVFTNIDRMAQESGTVLAVKQALRELEIRRRQMLREMRDENERLRRGRRADEPPADEPPAEPSA